MDEKRGTQVIASARSTNGTPVSLGKGLKNGKCDAGFILFFLALIVVFASSNKDYTTGVYYKFLFCWENLCGEARAKPARSCL